MGKVLIFLASLLIMISIGIFGYKMYQDNEDISNLNSTSDAKNIKDKIIIATDDWQGYSEACSNEMKKNMAKQGYLLICKNDGANYEERFLKLKNNEYDLAFSTIDAYIKTGSKFNFPGTIIAMIDESKGGDAVLSKKYNSIKELSKEMINVGYVSNSPSEFLWNVVSKDFGIKYTAKKYDSEAEIKDNDVIVAWEPLVSNLQKQGYKKIIGSESTNGLIMDVLIENRNVKNQEKIKIFLAEYFAHMKQYVGNKNGIELYGITNNKYFIQEDMFVNYVSNIAERLNINIDNPYSLVNTSLLSELIKESNTISEYPYSSLKTQLDNPSLYIEYAKLEKNDWLRLKQIGNINVNQINFLTGSPLLTKEGKEELDSIAKTIKQYTYRVIIKGHSSLQGDSNVNLELSESRAKAVENYLIRMNNIDQNRIISIGVGGEEPLEKNSDESVKNYNKRLQRVEFIFVKE